MNKTASILIRRSRFFTTLGAARAAPSGDSILEFLARHLSGDWGDLSAEDKAENELSVRKGFRILSAYTLLSGERIWIITEAVNDKGFRESTCILLPSDY